MSHFRAIRQRIRNLGPLQYWGIQQGRSVCGGSVFGRFFVMQGPAPYRTVFEKRYRVNWQKRLSVLEAVRSQLQAQKEKHWPVSCQMYR